MTDIQSTQALVKDTPELAVAFIQSLEEELRFTRMHLEGLQQMLNTPELKNFLDGVKKEAAHQSGRWKENDKNKTHPEWFWLVGYLSGKGLSALMRGDTEKGRHHLITTAAALYHWHTQLGNEVSGSKDQEHG